MRIEILGDVGDRCDALVRNVLAAEEKLGRHDLVIRVRDPDEIAARGVWKTPALAINGEIETIDAVMDPDRLVEVIGRFRDPSEKLQ